MLFLVAISRYINEKCHHFCEGVMFVQIGQTLRTVARYSPGFQGMNYIQIVGIMCWSVIVNLVVEGTYLCNLSPILPTLLGHSIVRPIIKVTRGGLTGHISWTDEWLLQILQGYHIVQCILLFSISFTLIYTFSIYLYLFWLHLKYYLYYLFG